MWYPNLVGLVQGDGAVVERHVSAVGEQPISADGGDVAVVQAGVKHIELGRLLHACMYVCMYAWYIIMRSSECVYLLCCTY